MGRLAAGPQAPATTHISVRFVRSRTCGHVQVLAAGLDQNPYIAYKERAHDNPSNHLVKGVRSQLGPLLARPMDQVASKH